MIMLNNPIFHVDFYKVGHVSQYPPGTAKIISNWTARKSRVPRVTSTVHLGLQYFIERYLVELFQKEFFDQPLERVLYQYRYVIGNTLRETNPKTDHISDLWKMGYLPLKIMSLPEGTLVPIGVPSIVLWNTDPRFFWLPNYIETMLSNIVWKPTTSATIARQFRLLCESYAAQTGAPSDFVDWQCHDFSYRGMAGFEDAALSGLGHLTQFSGTDTLPAILLANKYYNAEISCGGSVPATEHSVMCAGGREDELETFRRLIEDVYPNNIVSIVSDTWDLWKVLTEYIPALKDKILSRKGKVVIRPDSGYPPDILCGTGEVGTPAGKGALELLDEALGHQMNEKKFRVLNKAGVIYGDGINLPVAEEIFSRAMAKGYSTENIVLGVGSFTYVYQTRDVFGFAMKATAAYDKDDKLYELYKNPVTDSGMKKSARGIVGCFKDEFGRLCSVDRLPSLDALNDSEYITVFDNGPVLKAARMNSFDEIRKRARAELDTVWNLIEEGVHL